MEYEKQDPFIVEQANEVKEWVTKCLKENVFPREDYNELCTVNLVAENMGQMIWETPENLAWPNFFGTEKINFNFL